MPQTLDGYILIISEVDDYMLTVTSSICCYGNCEMNHTEIN